MNSPLEPSYLDLAGGAIRRRLAAGVGTDMVVGIANIAFRLHACRSLKEKRKVVKSIIKRIQNNFNASVAEVGSNDVHQRAEIGVSLVGNDAGLVNSKLDKIFNFVEDLGLAEIIDTDMEIITL